MDGWINRGINQGKKKRNPKAEKKDNEGKGEMSGNHGNEREKEDKKKVENGSIGKMMETKA